MVIFDSYACLPEGTHGYPLPEQERIRKNRSEHIGVTISLAILPVLHPLLGVA